MSCNDDKTYEPCSCGCGGSSDCNCDCGECAPLNCIEQAIRDALATLQEQLEALVKRAEDAAKASEDAAAASAASAAEAKGYRDAAELAATTATDALKTITDVAVSLEETAKKLQEIADELATAIAGIAVVTWYYTAVSEGQTIIPVPADKNALDVQCIYIEGARQEPGRGFVFDKTAMTITLAEGIPLGLEISIILGTYSDNPTDFPQTLASNNGASLIGTASGQTVQEELNTINEALESVDGTLRADLAKSTGSSLVGYKAPGTDTVARTIQDKSNENLSPKDFKAKGDGQADDTKALQNYFEASTGDINLYGGTYLISKNPDLATKYPSEPDFSDGTNNFSPCLALVGKKNIKIYNGTLIVKTHGMDAIALIACENVTVELAIQGPGVFPAIDVTTGYAEKGEERFGYDSAMVLAPNNGLDTSNYTSGAYDGTQGQFPNYNADGSQAAGWQNKWGKFLNGYIGSWACGIKVQRACRGILINRCHITGFNYGAVGIGIRNAAVAYGSADYTTESDVPDGVMVSQCYIRNCYSAGIYVLSGYRLVYLGNNIEDIGHPNGDDTLNASYDPGYGITHGRNRRIRNVTISENMIRNCRRKCIDFHGGGQAIITNNQCLEHGVVGIYAKCGSGWAPNYEPYNLIISNNYVRSRNVPASFTTGLLIGAKYTRSIDVGGGGEATQATYPDPFVKINNNYCELRAFDGVAISTGAGDAAYAVFQDIDISHNTVVLKCDTLNNNAEGIIVNAGAANTMVYRGQRVKLMANSIKQLNTLNLTYRSAGFRVQGIPKSLIAHGNTLDLNVATQTCMLCDFVVDNRTNYSFEGNQVVSFGARNIATIQEVWFYDNMKITRAAGAAAANITATLFRGIWQVAIAGTGDAFGAKQTQFASTGSGGTGFDVVRSSTTGFIANFGLNAGGLAIPAVTAESQVQINLKLISSLDSVN